MKRRIRDCSPEDRTYLEELRSKISYGGNPQHKKNPGDFGLNPPCEPRATKSLCDEICVFGRAEALRLLKSGIEHGFISEKINEKGFPQNIWAVITLKDGRVVPLESQLENPLVGCYHGYPLPTTDPMHDFVLKKWSVSKCLILK